MITKLLKVVYIQDEDETQIYFKTKKRANSKEEKDEHIVIKGKVFDDKNKVTDYNVTQELKKRGIK